MNGKGCGQSRFLAAQYVGHRHPGFFQALDGLRDFPQLRLPLPDVRAIVAGVEFINHLAAQLDQQARVFDEAVDILPVAHTDCSARVAVGAGALLRISRSAS